MRASPMEPAGSRPGKAETHCWRRGEHPTPHRGRNARDKQAICRSVRGEFFPCLPGAVQNWYDHDATRVGVNQTVQGMDLPYAWAVCHAGWWIEHDHHQVWVAGRRIHHHCPVEWVKSGKTTPFVPIHPRDIKGQPPLKRGRIFIPTKGKDGYSLTITTLDSGHPVALMKSPPHEFRSRAAPLPARAETPHMMAYALRQPAAATGIKLAMTRPVGVPIRFDHQTQSFSMAHQVMQGGHSATLGTTVGCVGGGFQGGRTGGVSGGGGSNSGGSAHGGAAKAPVSSSGSSSGVSSTSTPTSTATSTSSSASSTHH